MPNILGLPAMPAAAYPHEVTYHALVEEVPDDGPGTPIKSWPAGVAMRAAVQPGVAMRVEIDGTLREVIGVAILTPVNPLVSLDGQFRWVDPSTGETRKFAVAGRATDEGGVQYSWTTSTLEVT
jgi:hypothetical protein